MLHKSSWFRDVIEEGAAVNCDKNKHTYLLCMLILLFSMIYNIYANYDQRTGVSSSQCKNLVLTVARTTSRVPHFARYTYAAEWFCIIEVLYSLLILTMTANRVHEFWSFTANDLESAVRYLGSIVPCTYLRSLLDMR